LFILLRLLPILLLTLALSLGVACASEQPPIAVPTLSFDEAVETRVAEKAIEAAAKALLPTCTRTSTTRQSERLWIGWMLS
jgi:hypothetical protein